MSQHPNTRSTSKSGHMKGGSISAPPQQTQKPDIGFERLDCQASDIDRIVQKSGRSHRTACAACHQAYTTRSCAKSLFTRRSKASGVVPAGVDKASAGSCNKAKHGPKPPFYYPGCRRGTIWQHSPSCSAATWQFSTPCLGRKISTSSKGSKRVAKGSRCHHQNWIAILARPEVRESNVHESGPEAGLCREALCKYRRSQWCACFT